MSARDRGSSRRQSSSRHSSRRRKDRQKKHHLTQEDIEYLKQNTRYDETEIREWYKGFKVTRSFWREKCTRMNIIISARLYIKLLSSHKNSISSQAFLIIPLLCYNPNKTNIVMCSLIGCIASYVC